MAVFAGALLQTLLLLPGATMAVRPDQTLTQYGYDVWTTDDGLPQNSVRALVQGPRGYLWLGTYEGLALFDGVKFRAFTPHSGPMPEKNISALLRDAAGNIWIGTFGHGVYRIDRQWRVSHWTTSEGLSSDNIRAFVAEKQAIWVASRRGLDRIVDGQAEHQSGWPMTVRPMTSLFLTSGGNLWAGADGDGLFQRTPGSWTKWTTRDGLPGNRISAIVGDGGDGLWIATWGNGLTHFDGAHFETLTTHQGLANNLVLRLLLDSHGVLWIGTYGGGIQRLLNAHLESFGQSSNGFVHSLLEDREGTLWFGTSGGLNRFRDGKFLTYSKSEGLAGKFIRSVVQDRAGAIWVGADGSGLNRIRNGVVDLTVTQADGLTGNTIRALLPDPAGGLWISAFGAGLNYRNDTGIVRYTPADGLPSAFVRALYLDSDDVLWVGSTDHGLVRYSAGKFGSYTTADGLPNNDVRAIIEYHGQMLLGTYGGGIMTLKNGVIQRYLPQVSGLSKAVIFTFFRDTQNKLWIGSENGLSMVQDGRFNAFASTGLDAAIFQILEDDSAHFWLCGNSGIQRVSRTALESYVSDKKAQVLIDSFGRGDGMRTAQCNGATQPAAWKAADGRMWFPTPDGVVVVDPAKIPRNPIPPPVDIETLVADGRVQELSPGEELSVPAGSQRIEIHYTGLSMLAPRKVRFQYRLAGLDRDWVSVGGRRTAFFTNLSPGHYTFSVRAANNDGLWNEIPAQTRFFLRPYFYQTPLFYAATLGLLLTIVFFAYRMRIRSLRVTQQKLEQQVSQRTSELHTSNAQLEHTLDELRSTQAQLIKSEKLAAMGSLVAGVAHEINTPLGNCVTVSSSLLDQCDDLSNATAENKLTRSSLVGFVTAMRSGMTLLQRNLGKTATLIRDFRKLAMDQRSTRQTQFNLADFLRELCALQQPGFAAAGHRLELGELADISMHSYRELLAEALEQLLGNALLHAFAAPGGHVGIATQGTEDHISITLKDDGVGMTDALLEHLFEPFAAGVKGGGGAGLGLHIVYNLVHGPLGGRIQCRRRESGGSIFCIELPRVIPD